MKVLLVIDMQEGFRFPQTEALLPGLVHFLPAFPGPAVFTQFVDHAGSSFERSLNWPGFQQVAAQKLLAEIHSFANEKNVFKHNGYSIFTSEMQKFLQSHLSATFYLGGIYTDVVILHTALEMFDRSFNVKVIKDLCASPNDWHHPGIHEGAITTISHAIGRDNVVTTKDVVSGNQTSSSQKISGFA